MKYVNSCKPFSIFQDYRDNIWIKNQEDKPCVFKLRDINQYISLPNFILIFQVTLCLYENLSSLISQINLLKGHITISNQEGRRLNTEVFQG